MENPSHVCSNSETEDKGKNATGTDQSPGPTTIDNTPLPLGTKPMVMSMVTWLED